jgi:hypothetical protein
MAVKTRPNSTRTKRPRGALLQFGIASIFFDCQVIGGSASDNVRPLVEKCGANLGTLKTSLGNVLDGQFYWGGTLLKSNAGVQRLAYYGWKS